MKLSANIIIDGVAKVFNVVYMYNYRTHPVPRSLTSQFPRSNAISRCVTSGEILFAYDRKQFHLFNLKLYYII